MEMNLSHLDRAVGNFRINIFRQRGTISLVIRYVRSNDPAVRAAEAAAGAARPRDGEARPGADRRRDRLGQVDHAGGDDRPPQQQPKPGHILTIEDPIEYLFEHKQSIVNQREIDVDTLNYTKALQNALREAPDLIMIGEIRDKETMQQALLHTLTGHLCLTTIHANNSYHALSRIINLFPYDARSAVLSDLSIGLRAIVCAAAGAQQGRRRSSRRSRSCSTPSLIAELVKNGEFAQIKEAMEQSLYPGSQTFEQALCRLYLDGVITYDEAMIASDSPTNLAWLINQNAPTARVDAMEHRRSGENGSGGRRPTSAALHDRRRSCSTARTEPRCRDRRRGSRQARSPRARRPFRCHRAHGRGPSRPSRSPAS